MLTLKYVCTLLNPGHLALADGILFFLFGHRGAAGEAPENTLTGFVYAYRLGIRSYELDIHLSADGDLVVIHDESPQRTMGIGGVVGDFTVAELAAFDARAVHKDWPEAAPIPTLAQVLAAFPELDAYQIEIKRTAPAKLPIICRRLAEVVQASGVRAKSIISSFDPAILAVMRDIAPHFPRAFTGTYDSPQWVEQALSLGCTVACIPHKTSSLLLSGLPLNRG